MSLELFPEELHGPGKFFTIVDTETTGIYAEGGDRLIEVAAIRQCGSTTVAVFSSLIRPGRAIPADATRLNRIRDDMVDMAPSADDVLPMLRSFLRADTLVFQNARFDLAFLNAELRRTNLTALSNTVLDTRLMAKALWPGLPGYGLDRLAAQAGVLASGKRHRALPDARLTLRVFRVLLEEARRAGIRTLLELQERCEAARAAVEIPQTG